MITVISGTSLDLFQKGVWAHYPNLQNFLLFQEKKNNNLIKLQVCIYYDSLFVLKCAKWCSDWITRIEITAKGIITRSHSRAQKPVEKWVTSYLCGSFGIHSLYSGAIYFYVNIISSLIAWEEYDIMSLKNTTCYFILVWHMINVCNILSSVGQIITKPLEYCALNAISFSFHQQYTVVHRIERFRKV